MNKRAEATERRDAEIIAGVKAGFSIKEVATRVGVEPDYAKRLIKKHGIKTQSGRTLDRAFGMTDETKLVRSRLYAQLVNLALRKDLHPLDVARMIGLTETEQRKNARAPHNHDWKISQIERLATALEVDVKDLLQEVIRPRRPGEII